MKTPDEIKKAARLCNSGPSCPGSVCPYYPSNTCVDEAREDVLAYIEQLEKKAEERQERIDLMLIQMRGDCGVCKHRGEYVDGKPTTCYKCRDGDNKPLWEYEGLPGDEV